MTRAQIMRCLKRRPMTAGEIAELFNVRTADVSSDLARIRKSHGEIERSPTGRGSVSTYRLVS